MGTTRRRSSPDSSPGRMPSPGRMLSPGRTCFVAVVDADWILDVSEGPRGGEESNGAAGAAPSRIRSADMWSAACPERTNHAGGRVEVDDGGAQRVREGATHGTLARVMHAPDVEVRAGVSLAGPRRGLEEGERRAQSAARRVVRHAPQQAQQLREVLRVRGVLHRRGTSGNVQRRPSARGVARARSLTPEKSFRVSVVRARTTT